MWDWVYTCTVKKFQKIKKKTWKGNSGKLLNIVYDILRDREPSLIASPPKYRLSITVFDNYKYIISYNI